MHLDWTSEEVVDAFRGRTEPELAICALIALLKAGPEHDGALAAD